MLDTFSGNSSSLISVDADYYYYFLLHLLLCILLTFRSPKRFSFFFFNKSQKTLQPGELVSPSRHCIVPPLPLITNQSQRRAGPLPLTLEIKLDLSVLKVSGGC